MKELKELLEIVNLTLNLLDETMEVNAQLARLMQTLEKKNQLLQKRLTDDPINFSSPRPYRKNNRLKNKS